MATMIDETKVRYFVVGSRDGDPIATLQECASAEEAGRVLQEYSQLGVWDRLCIVVKDGPSPY